MMMMTLGSSVSVRGCTWVYVGVRGSSEGRWVYVGRKGNAMGKEDSVGKTDGAGMGAEAEESGASDCNAGGGCSVADEECRV